MTAATGFLEQKPRSPTGFGLVLLLHGAAIAGVLTIKNVVIDHEDPPLVTVNIKPQRPPPPVPVPPPSSREVQVPAPSVPSPPIPIITPREPGPTIPAGPPAPIYNPNTATSAAGTGGTGTATVIPPIERPRPTPVRVDALFDSRGGEQQPPYPASEQRAEREGSVRVQVRVGANGRVLAVSRLSATSDAFWRATERHALSRWRFRPATVDGQPIESNKILTVHFRLDGS